MSEQNVIVYSMVNDDFVNDEASSRTVIQSRLQRILARYCVVHREQSYIQHNMFKTFLERVFPTEYQLNACNTLFYTLICKRFNIENKTTMACIGDDTPSKHETVGGTAYRNVAIVAVPAADRILLDERAGAVTDEDRKVYRDWLFLKWYPNQNKTILPTLNYDTQMVTKWFSERPLFPTTEKGGSGQPATVSATFVIHRKNLRTLCVD